MSSVVIQPHGDMVKIFVESDNGPPACLIVMDELSDAIDAANMMAAALRLPVTIRAAEKG
jgi:hypothetical protein